MELLYAPANEKNRVYSLKATDSQAEPERKPAALVSQNFPLQTNTSYLSGKTYPKDTRQDFESLYIERYVSFIYFSGFTNFPVAFSTSWPSFAIVRPRKIVRAGLPFSLRPSKGDSLVRERMSS